MAIISKFKVDGLRNLSAVDLETSPDFNVFIGSNGSGKTSLLEALHILSVGRSFRTQKNSEIIQHGAACFSIFAQLRDIGAVGVQRFRHGQSELRFQGETQPSWQSVAALLPLQVLDSDSFALLEGPASRRRRFLDWGMFHVEHSFLQTWRRYKTCLRQRNALLKRMSNRASPDARQELDYWTEELVSQGQLIHEARTVLLDKILPIVQSKGSLMNLSLGDLNIQYSPGWDDETGIENAISESIERDMRYGMSMVGPHRSDFMVMLDGHPANEVLSRGQTKTLVALLKISMSEVIQHSAQSVGQERQAAYLIDDLPAELDIENQVRILRLLETSRAQCFITGIDAPGWPSHEILKHAAKFHVEHGKIRPA